MRFFRTVFMTVALITSATFAAGAQAPAQPAPAKIGVVNSTTFSNTTGGITRYVSAIRVLETEFKPRRDEIMQLVARFDELQKTPAGMTPPQLQTRLEQAETLQRDITRKQEDARAAYARRFTQLTAPLQKTIGDALVAFAKARGLDIILAMAKFPEGLLLVNPGVDLTAAFIRDFNSKNP